MCIHVAFTCENYVALRLFSLLSKNVCSKILIAGIHSYTPLEVAWIKKAFHSTATGMLLIIGQNVCVEGPKSPQICEQCRCTDAISTFASESVIVKPSKDCKAAIVALPLSSHKFPTDRARELFKSSEEAVRF